MTTAERRILVVEDSATQAQRVQLVLEEAGYSVELAVNGREGVAKVRASPPDMIMSDVVMPEMDGFAFCQAVKSDPALRRIPFALLTGQRSPRDIVRGLEVGADNFITKPFEDAELLARVARIFENLDRRRRGRLDMEMTVRVAGREIMVNADREQMIELLFSTSEDLAQSNRLLEDVKLQLEEQARELEHKVEERTRELRTAEERYRQLVEQAPAVTYLADPAGSGRVLYISPQVEPLLGYPVAEWLADPGLLSRALHPDDRRLALAAFAGLGQTTRTVSPEFRLLHRDGHVVWVSDEAHVIHGEGGDSLYVQGFLIDITERRHLETQLNQSQKLDAVGRLAGGLAHDFNNLLGVISGYGELAHREIPSEHPIQGRLEQILRASRRAAELTKQLLAFSRKQMMQPRVLDLGAALADVEQMLHRLIGEDIILMVRNATGLGNVRADPSQIEQVILNLAVNARDAMPKGGTLTLETNNVELDEDYVRLHAGGAAGRYVMLAVSDTGIGMDEQTQARIFEPFFTTKPEGKGTGLGLATVYGIVKQSAGHIWVYSELDHGTTFKVYLPRVDAPVEMAPGVARAVMSRGTETVLLVEDQEPLRAMIHELLEEQGYNVLEAEGGHAALEIAAKRTAPIHLLLTDVVMPLMSGRELADRLVRERPECRVLFMSGYSNGAMADRGMLLEGAAILEKPFTSDALGRSVRDALDAPSLSP